MKRLLFFFATLFLSASVYSQCTAGFTYSVSGNTVTFQSTSSVSAATASQFQWNFGDGNSGGAQDNISHTYATPGAYQVCLLIVDFTNCMPNPTLFFCDSVVVGNSAPCNYNYTFTESSPGVFDFDNTPQVNTPATINWTVSNGQNSTSNDPTFNITSPAFVCMTVIDFACSNGPTFQVCDSIFPAGTGGPCNYDFTYVETTPGVFAVDNSPNVSGSATINWTVSPMGQTSNQNDPTFNITVPSQICMTVVDMACPNGPTFFVCDSVFPGGGPVNCNYNYTFNETSPGVFAFDNTPQVNSPASIIWTVTDGQTSNQNDPTFTISGPQMICMVVVDMNCSNGPTFQVCDSIWPSSVPTGINEMANNGFELYPNPASDLVQINADMFFTEIELTDLSGRWVVSTSTSATRSLQMSLADIRNGIYLVRLKGLSGEIRTQRLVIQR